jgi:hypothetical protein
VVQEKPTPAAPSELTSPEQVSSAIAPPGSILDTELQAFQTAFLTGISRHTNEGAPAFVSRAHSLAHSQSSPTTAAIAASVVDDLLEAHRTLSKKDLGVLNRAASNTLTSLGKSVGIERANKEPLIDYAARVKSSLQARAARGDRATEDVSQASAEGAFSLIGSLMGVKNAPLPPSPGLTWTIALFRGFLQDYFSSQEIQQISDEAAAAQPGVAPEPSSEDELTVYSRLVKNAIIDHYRRSGGEVDVDHIIREFDKFVEVLKAGGVK